MSYELSVREWCESESGCGCVHRGDARNAVLRRTLSETFRTSDYAVNTPMLTHQLPPTRSACATAIALAHAVGRAGITHNS
jgi:hypothetical protein